jgi:histidine ammonia-lyase
VTVLITGTDLTRREVTRVAREGEAVALDAAAVERMRASRRVVEQALARGDEVYGLSTAVGVLKRIALADEGSAFSDRLVRDHLVGLGPPAPRDVVRATTLRLANEAAGASLGIRPQLAERLVTALNRGDDARVRTLGSTGQSDLAPLADLVVALFGDVTLAPGEGLALINNNSFSTGWASLALSDAATLLGCMETAGALSLEAIAANGTMLHPAIDGLRPYPGLRAALRTLRDLLEDSFIWRPGAARSLQDPLTFRNLPQLQGACRDAFEHADRQLAVELNASQGNPIVVVEEGRIVSVANFEILPLAAALDLLRIVLATALTAATERVVKMLERPWSGLPTGLTPEPESSQPGLAYLGIASQALAAEVRLLAQPVSFELASTSHAEGIEDRMTMAPLAARRLSEMVELGGQIVARELVVAAQAVELRGVTPLGRGTSTAVALVRRFIPFLEEGDTVRADLEPVVELVRAGDLVLGATRW